MTCVPGAAQHVARLRAEWCAADPGSLRHVLVRSMRAYVPWRSRISGAPLRAKRRGALHRIRETSWCEIFGQITPIGVELINQGKFPGSTPTLERCFP